MTGFASKRMMSNQMLDGLFADLPIENLIVSEGKVYGARYHTVYPVGGNWKILEQWCTDTFGPTSVDGVWTPGMRWYVNNRKFWFRKEQDLTMFILKWS